MKYDKPFLTYLEQIELLKKRGMIISNNDFAIHALNTISLYHLPPDNYIIPYFDIFVNAFIQILLK